MAMVNRNPAGMASKKNQRKDSKAKPVSRIKRTAMEGTGAGNGRGRGTRMPKAMARPREPASGAGSARKASLGQGMKKMDTRERKKVPCGKRDVANIQSGILIAKRQWRTYAVLLKSEERE